MYLLLLGYLPAHGQSSSQAPSQWQEAREDKDSKVILELGAATNWNFSGGAATFAPNLAAEITPIENWLEIEAGISPFYTRKSTEWGTDLLFIYVHRMGLFAAYRRTCGICRPNQISHSHHH
jgi:hypothetical protein